jgi:hypothetical protein
VRSLDLLIDLILPASLWPWARISQLKPPAHADSSLADLSTLKVEAIHSSETSVHTRCTRRQIPENDILHSHRREKKQILQLIECFPLIRHGPHRRRHVQQCFCCMCIRCRGNVFTEPLPNNDSKIQIQTQTDGRVL